MPPASVYSRILAGIGVDGSVSRDVALQAFSALIAPLPGVVLPGGDPPEMYERADGSLAVAWITQHYESLTPEQKHVVDTRLTPDPQAAIVMPSDADTTTLAGFAAPLGATAEQLLGRQIYLDALNEAQALLTTKLGRPLRVPWSLTLHDTPTTDPGVLENALAYTQPYIFPGLGQFGCAFYVEPSLRGIVGLNELRVTMAHEMFHCFQFDLIGPTALKSPRAAWIIEGQAEWAGEALMGPALYGRDWWARYLHDASTPLFQRTYDAVGFYEHMSEVGIDPWTHFDAMLRAADNNAAYEAAFRGAGDKRAAFLDTWASGVFRDASLGTEWHAEGRWVTSAKAVPYPLELTDALPVAAGPVTTVPYRIIASTDVAEVRIEGSGRLGVGVGSAQLGLSQRWLCTKPGGCGCPPGQSFDGPPLEAAPRVFSLALTGGLAGIEGLLRGHAIAEFCRPDATPTAGSSGAGGSPGSPGCQSSCASSNGDPHLRTVDGTSYDLQAVGEYVLLRAPSGDLEVQARQEPFPGESAVSVNTAVAARVGTHVVATYVTQHGLETRVDGEPADLSVPIDLGGGAQVAGYENGLHIAFGDGTDLFLVSRRPITGINIAVRPSSTLRREAMGLLGTTLPDGLRVPALPDGTRLRRATDAHDRFELLYGSLAPAWLVTSAESLFDYEPGRSTESYRVEGYPEEAELSSVDDLTPEQREEALSACSGVTDGDLLLECMFDVSVTDLQAWAELYRITDRVMEGGAEVLDEPVPPLEPGPLPAGFVQLAPEVRAIRGSTIGPDGLLYVSLEKANDRFEVVVVDPVGGVAVRRVDAVGGGRVAFVDGSLWVGEFATDVYSGSGTCSVSRLEPTTLALLATIPTSCDSTGTQFAALGDAVWFVDRTTANVDGIGGRLRRIDPATDSVGTSVELPFVNGFLQASDGAIFWGDQGQDRYRLRDGETEFESIGPASMTMSFPSGEGVWSQTDGVVRLVTAAGATEREIALAGTLVGVDESAVYTDLPDTFDSTATLWRYGRDGGTPTAFALGTTVRTAVGDIRLGYADADPFLVAPGQAIKLWLLPRGPDPALRDLIMQVVPLP